MNAMWQGKKKAVTFSYDDGTTQDARLIYLLDQYRLKATFNLNSGRFGRDDRLEIGQEKQSIAHIKYRADEIKNRYSNHEVAAHGVDHLFLPDLSEEEIIHEVEDDRLALSDLVGYEVVGYAYSCREVDDERIRRILRDKTGVKYCRAVNETGRFDLPQDLYCIHASEHHLSHSPAETEALVRRFLETDSETPQLLYIWGHSFELDIDPSRWDRVKHLFELLSGHEDVFYGTNRQIFLKED